MPKIRNTQRFNKKNRDAEISYYARLEHDLIRQRETAHKQYYFTCLKSKNNLNTHDFYSCKEKFRKMMSLIEKKGNPTPLTNEIYFEAWTSLLYSDIYALRFDYNTEEQFNALNKKILALEIDLNQLLIKKINLDSNQKNSAKQLKRIDNLHHFFLFNKFKLKAACCYKLSKFFTTALDFEKSIYYLEKAIQFFYEGAKSSIHPHQKKEFIKMACKAKKRTQLIQQRLSKNPYGALTPPLKQLVIYLEKVPQSLTQWTIVDKRSLFPTKNTPKAMKHSSRYPSKRKRGLGHSFPGPQTKKIDVHPTSLISTLSWETEGKHLMNQFRLLKINDNLEGILKPFHPRSLNERTALVYNNYAITLIENLCTPHLSIPHAKARDLLIHAKEQFIKSAYCYTQAGLLKQKGKIIECINHITASLEKLSRFVNPNAQETAHVQTPKKYTFRKKSEMNNQTPYYLTRTFFKRLPVEAILPTTNTLDYSY